MLAASLILLLTAPLSFAPVPQGGEDPTVALRAAAAAAEREHGPDSLEVAEALLKLVPFLQRAGKGAEALTISERVVAIREAKLPAGHSRIGIALNNLGGAYLERRRLEEAIATLLRAKAVFEQNPPGRALLGALTNLGIAEGTRGRYQEAQRYLEDALAQARRFAPDHVYLGLVLQNLAQVKINLGEVEVGRALVEEALAVFLKVEPDGLRRAHAIFGLAVVLSAAGRWDEAGPLFEQALALRTQLLGAEHGLVATIHDHWGRQRVRQGRYAEARPHLEASLQSAVRERDLEAQAIRSTMLAWLCTRVADSEGATRLLRDALAAAERARMLPVRRLEIDWLRGEMALAEGKAAEAAVVLRRVLAVELESTAVWSTSSYKIRSQLARALAASGKPAQAAALLQENVALFGGRMRRLLPAMLERERLAEVQRCRQDLDLLLELSRVHPEVGGDTTIYEHVLVWKGQVARARLSQQLVAREDPEGLARLRRLQQIASQLSMASPDAALLAEKERLETDLGRAAPTDDGERVRAAALMAALPAEAAFVDLLRYRDRDGAQRFVAFVVHGDQLQRVELGAADPIAQAVQEHVLLTSRSLRAGAAAVSRSAALAVRKLVLDPLAPTLGSCKVLWISPDDVLATLPFETLPGDVEGSYLLESLEIGYLQDAHDLLRPARPVPLPPRVLALGGIDYGSAPVATAALRGVPRPFLALPRTLAEVEGLQNAAGAEHCDVLRGREAGEQALRERAAGATYLHLATHGFCGDEAQGECGAGVALAGANEDRAVDDGILTSAEAALLDLRACRLVVLSACETGLGRPFAGESLLGLRRAMHIAGAQATLTSLWRVDDAATASLMADFYREVFVAGQTPSRALRKAQLQALERARASANEGLPGRWGAFVLEGRS